MPFRIVAHAAVALLAASALAGCSSMYSPGQTSASPPVLASYSSPAQPRVSPSPAQEPMVAAPQMSDTALPVRKQY